MPIPSTTIVIVIKMVRRLRAVKTSPNANANPLSYNQRFRNGLRSCPAEARVELALIVTVAVPLVASVPGLTEHVVVSNEDETEQLRAIYPLKPFDAV